MSEELEPEVRDAITKASVLRKLRFLRYGEENEKRAAEFREELLAFHKQAKGLSFTKQGVRNWFPPKNSEPTGNDANLFLKLYFDSIPHGPLSGEQKKVLKQLEAYFRHFTLLPSQQKIRITKEGHLQFHPGRRLSDVLKSTDSIVGVFLTYKTRYTEDSERPFAQEVLHVFMRDHDLRFEHWYIRQGDVITKFEGSVLPLDNVLWFFGVTAMPPGRLRVMSFRRTDELNNIYDRFRWGLAHSDIPLSQAHDPAACRILLTPAPDMPESEVQRFARANVKHLTLEQLPAANRNIIERLVDNKLTALSIPKSIDPAVDANGPIVDAILKVDQRTMQVAIDKWAGKPAQHQEEEAEL